VISKKFIVSLENPEMFLQVTGTATPAMPAVVFLNSWRRPLSIPLRSVKTFKPLAFFDLKGGKGYTHLSTFIFCISNEIGFRRCEIEFSDSVLSRFYI